ncbi:MAG TPA: hypothetical protein DF613_09725 [Lachnospiraceae bacterium]|nr:hypothetical protein [Lachnospiraceae bacterium]
MAKSIKVTPKTLTDKATQLKNLNKNFKQKVADLRSLEQKLDSMWDGDANDSFRKDFQKDATQMDNFYNAVEAYVSTLNQIADNYANAEAKNKALSEN